MDSRFSGVVVSLLMVAGVQAFFAGCIGKPHDPAATQPVTVSDPATTQASYWLDQPATASAKGSDFEKLARGTEAILRDYCFAIDRVDYRLGIITTEPLVGAQFFEPWRRDNQTAGDVVKSSLGTRRRTVRVDIARNDDGTFTASPRVLLERISSAEQRITNVVAYRGARKPADPRAVPRGTKESDQGILIPSKYWYAIGRDEPLERKLAEEIQTELNRHPS
jgi:hypothetical protein